MDTPTGAIYSALISSSDIECDNRSRCKLQPLCTLACPVVRVVTSSRPFIIAEIHFPLLAGPRISDSSEFEYLLKLLFSVESMSQSNFGVQGKAITILRIIKDIDIWHGYSLIKNILTSRKINHVKAYLLRKGIS